jgi:hypothetical protein
MKISSFYKHSQNNTETITRIVDFKSIIEFVKHKKLHFAPISCFEDLTEGKSFKEANFPPEDDQKNSKKAHSLIRRKIMYASCWFNGDETLYMWDIYGRNERYFALQLNLYEFVELNINTKNISFESETFDHLRINKGSNTEFRPSNLYYGNVDYINLLQEVKNEKRYFIGRFKDSAFSHENEFRLLLRQNYKNNKQVDIKDLKCVFSKIELKKLGAKIIVSPYAPSYIFEMIKSELKDNNNVIIQKSKFSPLFN